MTTVSPLKGFGGKYYQAERIVSLMPQHVHYVEPYFGTGAVLFRKPYDNTSEVVNDIDDRLTNFWRVLQDEALFSQFARRIQAVPFSQELWEESQQQREDSLDDAVAFFIFARQSSGGQQRDFATLTKTRLRRSMNEQASAWLTVVDRLPEVHERLRRVVVLHDNAVDVIRKEDRPETLFYLDPPYLHQTRVATDVYRHEMSEADHRELLDTIRECAGKVILSGYPNDLYDQALSGWRIEDRQIDNKASRAKSKPTKTERLWLNY